MNHSASLAPGPAARAGLVLWWVLATAVAPALGQDAPVSDAPTPASPEMAGPAPWPAADDPPSLHYVLGAIATVGPDAPGSPDQRWGLRPAWAVEYGRFRLSTGRGSALLGHGIVAQDAGASAVLSRSEQFQLRLALRVDGGRDAGRSDRRAGLPEVRGTVRARLSATYAFTPRWSVGLSASQDVLGRGGGAEGAASLGYSLPLSGATRLNLGAGLHWADRRYLGTRFGVPASAVGLSPWPLYEPSAGFYSASAGAELVHALSRHWVAWGGVGVSQLQGPARRSPLAEAPRGYSASVGLAYRCCR